MLYCKFFYMSLTEIKKGIISSMTKEDLYFIFTKQSTQTGCFFILYKYLASLDFQINNTMYLLTITSYFQLFNTYCNVKFMNICIGLGM